MRSAVHSDTSPSKADIWRSCPASVELTRRMTDQFGESDASEYAAEGTRAHEIAAQALLGDSSALRACPREMADHLLPYLASIAVDVDLADGPVIKQIEQHMVWGFDPRIAGTADAIVIADGRLIVTDLKYGANKFVSADCLQLRIYGFLAYDRLHPDRQREIDTIVLRVVQPRHISEAPIIRQVQYPVKEFIAETEQMLLAALKAIDASHPPCVEGPHCHWCEAQPICPAKIEMLRTLLASADTIATTEKIVDEKSKLAILYAINHAKQIESLVRSAKAAARRYLLEGGDLEGWALKESFANRSWRLDDGAISEHLIDMGLELDQMYSQKLITPAQAEKLLGKGKIEELTERVPSGYAMTQEKGAVSPDYAALFAAEDQNV